DPDALRPGLHRALDRLLHRLLEGDAPAQLLGDVHRHEVGVELRLADLLDLELDPALRQLADLLGEDLRRRPPLAEDTPRFGLMDRDRQVVDAALDLAAGPARIREPPLHELAD